MLFERTADLERIADADQLWTEIVQALRGAGIDHVIYLTVDRSMSDPILRSTLNSLYSTMRPQDDPFLAHCCNSYDISRTGEAFLDEHKYLKPADIDLIRGAAAEGFRTGMGIPMRLQGSRRFGGFNLGTGLDRDAFQELIWPLAEDFRLFCLIMHRRIEELTRPTATPVANGFRAPMIAPGLPGLDSLLSPREREVAYLLARGRSRKEVAHICGISVHTVSEYAKGAYSKLGIRNRAQMAQLIFAADNGAPPPPQV